MFKFPETIEYAEFNENLLRSAIFQIKYPKNEQVQKQDELIANKLTPFFPNKKTIKTGEAHIEFKKEGTPILQAGTTGTVGFEFRTKDNNKVIAVTSDSLTYTIFGTEYTNFQDVASQMKDIFLPLLAELNITSFNRIATRKINIPEITSDDDINSEAVLSALFNQSFVENFLTLPCSEYITSGMSNIDLNKDNYRLILKYGILPPKAEEGRQLLLDIDYIFKKDDIDPESTIEELRNINMEIYKIFTWALKTEILDTMPRKEMK